MLDNIGRYEGTVEPSFLKRMGAGKAADLLNKLPLRMGRVIRVHAPTDPTNRSGAFFEYDVLAEEGSEHAINTRSLLPHCCMISEFGGAADFSRSTPRLLDTDLQDTQDFGTGSRVLVLLINASSFAGVIIGGTQHPKGEKDDQAKGHHSIWQFNGVRREVDKDGQLHFTMKGATTASGSLIATATATAEGTGFHLLSDGTVQWDAKADWNQTVGGGCIVDVQNDIRVSSALGAIAFESLGLITTTSSGVHLGLATDAMLLGTTYRVAEATLHTTKAAGWTAAAASEAAVAAFLTIFAPFSIVLDPTSTLLIAAAAAAGIAGASAGAAGASAGAIGAFEAAGPSYESLKNKLDR